MTLATAIDEIVAAHVVGHVVQAPVFPDGSTVTHEARLTVTTYNLLTVAASLTIN